MTHRIPDSIRPLLQTYLDQLDQHLPDFAQAVYLHGSIALDAFDDQRSDIDFITVINRTATADDVQKLSTIHKTIAAQYPRWLFEGSYLQAADLGQAESAITPHPTHHDNVLNPAGHFDTNPVTWWLLKNKGIAIRGADPQTLPYSVDWNALLTDMHHNMNTYWASFTYQPSRMLRLLVNDGVSWAVLGVLRQYYTFKENDITSKVGAGQYALQHLPSKWHSIIQDALDIREGRQPSCYVSRFTRAYATVRFLKYVIGLCV